MNENYSKMLLNGLPNKEGMTVQDIPLIINTVDASCIKKMMNDDFEEWDNKDWTIEYTVHGTYHIRIPGKVTYVFNEHDFQVLKKRINEAEQDKNKRNEVMMMNDDKFTVVFHEDKWYLKNNSNDELIRITDSKEDYDYICDLLNSLNNENDELKEENNKLSNNNYLLMSRLMRVAKATGVPLKND